MEGTHQRCFERVWVCTSKGASFPEAWLVGQTIAQAVKQYAPQVRSLAMLRLRALLKLWARFDPHRCSSLAGGEASVLTALGSSMWHGL